MEEGLQRQRDTGKTPVRKEFAGRLWGRDPGGTCRGASAACRAWAGLEGRKAGPGTVLTDLQWLAGPFDFPFEQTMFPPSPAGGIPPLQGQPQNLW